MLETLSSVWFATRVRLLHKRTSKVLLDVQQMSRKKDEIEAVEQELNACSAMLQQLLDYAQQNRVMTQDDYDIAEQIQKKLEVAKNILEDKKISWWKKVLSAIASILPVVGELLAYIASFLFQRNPAAGLLVAGISHIIGYLPASDLPED